MNLISGRTTRSMGYAYLETTGDVDVIPLFYLEATCSDFGKFLVCSFRFLHLEILICNNRLL